MIKMAAKLILAILFVFVGVSIAKVVELRQCEDDAGTCTVNEVRIDPCTETGSKPCSVKRRGSVTLSFDFTPHFPAETAKSVAFLDQAATDDIRFSDMNDNACLYTTCPLADGVRQTYSYPLTIGQKLPKGTFPVKWKLWNEANETQSCCFLQTIKIK